MTTVRIADLLPLIDAESSKQGVDANLVKRLLAAENTSDGKLNPDQLINLNTTSHKGAKGVGQVMPDTQAGLVRNGYLPADFKGDTPADQIKAMVATVREQMNYTGGDPVKVAAMYNGGFAALDAVKSGNYSALPAETAQYLKKVGVTMANDNDADEAGGTKMRTSTTVSGNGTPLPVLQHLQGAGAAYEANVASILDTIRGITSQTQGAAIDAQQAVTDMGSNKAVVERSQGEAIRYQEAQRQLLLNTLGVDALAADSELSKLRGEQAIAQEQMRSLQPQLQELRNKSFLTDPIGWLVSQVKLEQTAGQYNSAMRQYQLKSGQAEQLQIAATRQFGLQPGVSVDAAVQSAEAKAKAVEAEAKVKSFEIGQVARGAQMAAASTELRFADVQFANAKTMAQIMAEKFSIRQAEGVDKKLSGDVEQINVFNRMIGVPEITVDSYKALDAKTRTQMYTEAARNSLSIADSPGQAMEVLKHKNALRNFAESMSPQAVVFLRNLHDTGEAAIRKATALNASAKTDGVYANAINEQVKQWKMDAVDTNNNPMDPNNPFRLHPNVAAQSPSLKGNSIAQFVLTATDGGARLNDRDILQYATSQVSSGARTLEDVAQEVQRFYFEGTKFQDQTYRMSLLGFDRRNPVSGAIEYNVDKNMFSLFERFVGGERNPTANVKLFNKASVENFLLYSTVQQVGEENRRKVHMPGMGQPDQEFNARTLGNNGLN